MLVKAIAYLVNTDNDKGLSTSKGDDESVSKLVSDENTR